MHYLLSIPSYLNSLGELVVAGLSVRASLAEVLTPGQPLMRDDEREGLAEAS